MYYAMHYAMRPKDITYTLDLNLLTVGFVVFLAFVVHK